MLSWAVVWKPSYGFKEYIFEKDQFFCVLELTTLPVKSNFEKIKFIRGLSYPLNLTHIWPWKTSPLVDKVTKSF